MITKWFFQKDFCPYGLVKISATAADFNYSRIGWSSQSQVSTIYALNTEFYQNSDWGQDRHDDRGYVNISTQRFPLWFKFKEAGKWKWYCYDPSNDTLKKKYGSPYLRSVSYAHGMFNPRILFAAEVRAGGTQIQGENPVTDIEPQGTQLIANLPLIPLRYNPNADHGHGNCIYLTNILGGRYNKPSISTNLQFNNVPIWMGFFGYWDFILQHQADKGVYLHSMFVVNCDALETLNQTTKNINYPIVDPEYCQGKLPWDEYLGETEKQFWYPTANWQKGTINTFVISGPYVPKYNDQKGSTWELDYSYKFFFKWGGPQVTDPQVEDPCSRNKYPVPDTVQQTVQITNPEKLHTESILHDWDFRRGYVTSTALKRMSEYLETDTDFQSDDSGTPKKKSKKLPKKSHANYQKEEKDQEMSPLTLRRAYMPRRNGGPPQAHQAAAAAAATPQKKHPQANDLSKKDSDLCRTPNRTSRVKLTLFKPGFEQQTELELAQAFKRPVRKFKEDPPYYPWLPPQPLVNFHLNFKG